MNQTFLGARQPLSTRGSRAGSRSYGRRNLILVSRLATRDTPGTKRPQNEAGSFWVSSTCIDCDVCRWMAPSSFTRQDGQSAVTRQPETHAERVRALQALVSCPTGSIHADDRDPAEFVEAQLGLPAPIPGVDGIFHNGYHHEGSHSATSYFVKHPAGNIMVDSPRFSPVLAKQLEAMGGVKYIFLTHKDNVAGHEKWAGYFNAVRIIHEGEMCDAAQGVEILLEGEGPWSWSHVLNHRDNHHHHQQKPALDDEGIELIFTPGHTTHHVCMYHPKTKTLFSGDHLAAPEDGSTLLMVSTKKCWYNLDIQMESVQKLLEYDWLHVLSGHRRQQHLKDATERLKAVSNLLQQHGKGAKHAMSTTRYSS